LIETELLIGFNSLLVKTRNMFYGTRYLSHCSTRFAFNPLFVNWVTSLTPRCHVTSLVTWPLEPHMVLSYWWSVDTKSQSRTVAEILSLKHFGVTTSTLLGHVTSSVTWPLEPQMVVSYWSSI